MAEKNSDWVHNSFEATSTERQWVQAKIGRMVDMPIPEYADPRITKKPIDWEQRKFELVKAALPACIADATVSDPVGKAFVYASRVIRKLQEATKPKE